MCNRFFETDFINDALISLDIRYELVNWKLPWKEGELRHLLKQSFIAFLLFLASDFDIWSDAMVAYSYIAGAHYEYHFEDHNVPELSRLNCTIILNSTDYRRYHCFEQDFNFGIGTLIIMLGPGFLLSVFCAWGLRKNGIASCILIIMSPVISVLYPVILFCVKVSLNRDLTFE